MQNNVFLDSFKTLGANAVPLPFSELFTALETNTVDGQENPYNTILSSKFYEVQKYLTVTNHVYSPWIVLVSKKYWDGLSKAEQKKMDRQPARDRRMSKPPSWNSALIKAGAMAALLFVFTQIGLFGGNTPIGQSLFLALFAVILYTPLAYATDKFVYSRAQKRRAAK